MADRIVPSKTTVFKEGDKQHLVFGEAYDRISSVGRTLEDFGLKEGIEYAFAAWTADVACDVIEAAVKRQPFNKRTVIEQIDGWAYEEVDVSKWPPEQIKKYLARHPRNMLNAAADRGTLTHALLGWAQANGWPDPRNVRHLVEDWTSTGRWLCDVDEAAACMASLANWAVVHDLKLVLVEPAVWCHRLKVAGRVDAYAVYQDELWLIDVKTRASVSGPRVEQVVQLAGYGGCHSALGADGEVLAPQWQRAGCLVCAPDGANLYEVTDMKKWQTMFTKALALKRATASVAGMTKGHGKVSLDLSVMLEVAG